MAIDTVMDTAAAAGQGQGLGLAKLSGIFAILFMGISAPGGD